MTFNLYNELGYLTEDQAKKIVKLTDSKSYLAYHVGYSFNGKANCTINVSVDTDDDLNEDLKKEVKNNYLAYLVNELLDNVRI